MDNGIKEKIEKFNAALPLEEAHTIPSSWYRDQDIYEAERRAIFGNSWQLVGRLAQLEKPGSYVTETVAGEPIVVLRDEKGKLRAFYNVCRHHAAKVALKKEGQTSRLRCHYHGWTYDLEGNLIGTPEFDGVCAFQRKKKWARSFTSRALGSLCFCSPRKKSCGIR